MSNPRIKGFADLYDEMLECKNGIKGGGTRGHTCISKKQAKELGIEWGAIEAAVSLLGLRMTRHASKGYSIDNLHNRTV